MKYKKTVIQSICAIFLALVMAINTLGSALAIQEQNVNQDPSSSEFMALSKYANATDIPDVYQITLTVEPAVMELAPIYISMGFTNYTAVSVADVWDSTTQTWILRAEAAVKSAQALIDTLIASGKKDIYISIFTYYSGIVAGGQFYPLYDSTGAVDPKLVDLSDGNSYLGNYGEFWWFRDNSNYVGRGLSGAYTEFEKANVPSNARRYFMFFSLGEDMDTRYAASQYAAALKAPLNESVAHMNLTYLTGSSKMGMNTKIWSVAIGNETTVNPNWQADWLSSAVTLGAFTTVSPLQPQKWQPGSFSSWESGASGIIQGASPSANVEPMMISFSIDLGKNASYASFPISQGFGVPQHDQQVLM